MSYRYLLLAILIGLSLSAISCNSNLLAGESPAAPAAAPPSPIVVDGMRTSYADVVEKTSAAVVRIEAEQKGRATQAIPNPFGEDNDFFRQFPQLQPRQNTRPQIERGFGSGVITSADGAILTNAHVVDGASKITVLLSDNKSYTAKVVGIDKLSDLAVLKIEGSNFPYLNLGNSDSVRVGDIVLAIGNPLGIGQSVTAGIISAKGRRTGLSDGSYEDFLQTDAPINRGNSGGALVNLTGELIGINSQILSPGGSSGGNIGIGFSIPSNMARSVMDQLLKEGRVRRGMLGINIQNITDDIATALELKDRAGVLVSNVRAGSAADKAGLKRNDIITAINGEKIEDSNVLRNKVAGTMPGTAIKITVTRDGSAQDFTATLDEFDAETSSQPSGNAPNEAPQEQGQGKLGITLQPLTADMARQLGLEADTGGLAVTDVDPSGSAAEAGVIRGDIVLEINRKAVKSLDDVKSAMDAGADRPILLLISRRGQTVYLTVRP
jgi:serine protease Do